MESADKAFENGIVDVSAMEALLEEKLATQLLQIHKSAKLAKNRGGLGSRPLSPVTPAKTTFMEANVEYIRSDGRYTPVYVINLPPAALTSQSGPSPTKGWVERNAALITAVATIISAIIAAATITWLAVKK